MLMTEIKQGYKKTKVGWIPQEWEVVNIGTVASLTAGGTPSTRKPEYWNKNEVSWMKSGEVNKRFIRDVDTSISLEGLNNSSAKLIPSYSVLIALAGQGKTRGTVAINEVELSTNQSVAAIMPSDSLFYLYLFYNLEARYEELRRLSTGDGGRGGLNLKLLKGVKIALPPLSEQKKIAQILSTWDKAIEKTKQLIEQKKFLKKGLMQQLFSQEIRFKDDNGNEFPEWETYKLNQITTPVKRKSNKPINAILTISAGNGFMNQVERFNKVVAGSSLDKYTLLKKNEFSYNRGNSKSYTYGCIYRLKNYEEALVPNVYRSFNLTKGVPEFFEQLFLFKYLDRQLRRLISSSARMDGLLNIGQADFYNTKVIFPCLDEQKKIAQVLDLFDDEITTLKKNQIKLQEQKKGLMQQLLTGATRVKV